MSTITRTVTVHRDPQDLKVTYIGCERGMEGDIRGRIGGSFSFCFFEVLKCSSTYCCFKKKNF